MARPLERITYVDDDPDIRAITNIALKMIGGFTVNVCASGREALEAVVTFHPDLILLDVMMPVMDGQETLDCLKRIPEFSQTPILFMTAKAQDHEIVAYKARGAIEVIVKPFDPLTLADQLRSLWNRIDPGAEK